MLEYYERTADRYDEWHSVNSNHDIALRLLAPFLAALNVTLVLDVACGTGRTWAALTRENARLKVRGCDLSPALIERAIAKGVPKSQLEISSGYHLPYANGAFDFVVEAGALHHVQDPDLFVREMLRVARIGIALSDSNMYAAGLGAAGPLSNNFVGALCRFILIHAGIWMPLRHLVRGKPYSRSEGDGIFYNYSIFETVRWLERVCAQVWVVPLSGRGQKNYLPLLAAHHCLVIAIKPGSSL